MLTDAYGQGAAVLGCKAIAAAQFTPQFLIPEFNYHMRPVAVARTPLFRGGRRLVSSDEAQVDSVSDVTHFVAKQLQLRVVGIREHDVGSAVVVVVEISKCASIGEAVAAAES